MPTSMSSASPVAYMAVAGLQSQMSVTQPVQGAWGHPPGANNQ